MRAILMILVAAVGLVLAGCASPRGGASEPGLANAGEGQSSGADSSEPQDYRKILADPGRF